MHKLYNEINPYLCTPKLKGSKKENISPVCLVEFAHIHNSSCHLISTRNLKNQTITSFNVTDFLSHLNNNTHFPRREIKYRYNHDFDRWFNS